MTSSNYSTAADDLMSLFFTVLGLIEREDWLAFERIALSSPCAFKILCSHVSECTEFNGMTLLHAVVRHNPPSTLLKQIIRLRPEDVVAVDCLGRTPLHVAAGSGASSKTIGRLVAAAPQTCDAQDEDKRTPLHLACDSSCELFEDEYSNAGRGPPDLDVVRFLLAGSQSSVLLEDIDDMTALEYAILSDAPVKVVQLLQKITQKQHKKRASNGSIPRMESPPSPLSVAV